VIIKYIIAYNGRVHTPVPDLLSNTQFTAFRAIQQKELSLPPGFLLIGGKQRY
jgi:hypothetical protein